LITEKIVSLNDVENFYSLKDINKLFATIEIKKEIEKMQNNKVKKCR